MKHLASVHARQPNLQGITASNIHMQDALTPNQQNGKNPVQALKAGQILHKIKIEATAPATTPRPEFRMCETKQSKHLALRRTSKHEQAEDNDTCDTFVEVAS